MLGALSSLNYLAVVVAAVAAFLIGFVWYLPPVMGMRWAGLVSRYTGITQEELMRGDQERAIVIWAVGMLVNALVLAIIIRTLGLTSLADAVVLGVLVWLGFGASFSSWPVAFARQPWALWAVNNGAFLLMQVVMAVILTLWR